MYALSRSANRLVRGCRTRGKQFNLRSWRYIWPETRKCLSTSGSKFSDWEDKPGGGPYRSHEDNPVRRTFNILSDDVKGYFGLSGKTQPSDPSDAPKNTEEKNHKSKDAEKIWPSFCDVLVIGGGAVGSSVAYHLKERALRGLNVVVVEEDSTYKRASTVLSVGGIRQQFSVPENIQLSSRYGNETSCGGHLNSLAGGGIGCLLMYEWPYFFTIRFLQITLPDGEKRNIRFSICVVAAGAWSGEVGRLVGIGKGTGIMGVPIPVEPRKRYVYCVHAPDGPGLDSPLLIDPNGTYFRREGLGGLYLCGQSPTDECEPSIENLDVDYDFFESNVWPTIANRVPSFENLKLQSSWAGYYDYNTFDQNGIIGLHPIFTNMFIATGFSGHGIQQAAGVGRAVMESILHGEYQTINLERFGFERVLTNEPLYEQNIV
ncbi:hypothetical protein C7M84_008826 [Penaeus vannamei]|uniref:FAD-dependent oxidoreductase domain-containing protein 1 n=1 Tax=Penaeus vannamei TaxID=6689 RepID=A0A3R7M5S3_PENVA|nr:hypothetical protein C7M84_008826 [Penaeus vannamei]